MSGEEMELIFTDDGIIVEGKNFTGKTCIDELEKLITGMKSMGIESQVTNQTKKQEYHVQRNRSRIDQRRT